MRNTPANDRALQVVSDAPVLDPVPARDSNKGITLALDRLHLSTASAFLTEPSAELSSLAAAAATTLAIGTDRERTDSRIRLAARMIAIARMQIQTLELSLADALERRDDAGIAMLSRVLETISKRMHRWLEEHRVSCSAAHRSVSVAVNAIGDITITGER